MIKNSALIIDTMSHNKVYILLLYIEVVDFAA